MGQHGPTQIQKVNSRTIFWFVTLLRTLLSWSRVYKSCHLDYISWRYGEDWIRKCMRVSGRRGIMDPSKTPWDTLEIHRGTVSMFLGLGILLFDLIQDTFQKVKT